MQLPFFLFLFCYRDMHTVHVKGKKTYCLRATSLQNAWDHVTSLKAFALHVAPTMRQKEMLEILASFLFSFSLTHFIFCSGLGNHRVRFLFFFLFVSNAKDNQQLLSVLNMFLCVFALVKKKKTREYVGILVQKQKRCTLFFFSMCQRSWGLEGVWR